MDDFITKFSNECNKYYSHGLLNNLISMRDVIKSKPSWYDEKLLLDFYYYNMSSIFSDTHPLEYRILMADMMPINNRKCLFRLDTTNIDVFKSVASKCNLDIIDDYGETFLFHLPIDNIRYITNLITSMDNLPLNIISKNGNTFLTRIIEEESFWENNVQELFSILSKKGYKFTLSLSHLIMKRSEHIDKYAMILSDDSFDLYSNLKWFRTVINTPNVYDVYILALFKRKDYREFLYRVYCIDFIRWDNNSQDYVEFILCCFDMSDTRTIEMLTFRDSEGNTVIHKMAQNHSKRLLDPLIRKFGSHIHTNNQGFTPKILYEQSKLFAT